ncbi:MAG: PEP-CTERM sorting domain-containing protein [Pirellulaceae bacterium]|nr:PEP-CTERM sorting domain-containing protein [Planctomycetales bacterium]
MTYRRTTLLLSLVCVALVRVATGQELLKSPGLDLSTLSGWDLQTFYSEPGSGVANSAEHSGLGFARFGDTGYGLWLQPYASGDNENYVAPVNAVLSQQVAVNEGQTYVFSGMSKWEFNYSGGFDILEPDSPLGAVASPTQTTMEMIFLDANNAMIGTPSVLDLRTEQTLTEEWKSHQLSATAPSGATSVRVVAAARDMVHAGDLLSSKQSAFFDQFSLTTTQSPLDDLLVNGFLDDVPTAPEGWTLTKSPDGVNSAQFQAATWASHDAVPGLWLRAFAGADTGADAVLSQTVPGQAGGNYTFSGWARWETNYTGGLETLDPAAPAGAIPSPTETLMTITFLGAGDTTLDEVSLDLRTVQQSDGNWHQQSLSAVAPEGTVNVRVTASATQMLHAGVDPQNAMFDDFSLTVEFANTLAGDYNKNGEVDAADYTVWKDNFGSSTELDADGNGNGTIDAADYTVWKDNFGATAGAAVATSSVPEPATSLLLGLLIGGLSVFRRKR